MNLEKHEKQFIKQNSDILSSLFSRRIDELEKMAGSMDTNLTAEEFKIKYLGYKNFINEMRSWLRTINILSKKNKTDTGI